MMMWTAKPTHNDGSIHTARV